VRIETAATLRIVVGDLSLTLACGEYDRTRPLRDGRVRVDGVELVYLDLPVEETFFRMMRHREFDLAELSFSSYVISCFEQPRPFVGLPVYPSRSFRHGNIFVNAKAGIEQPSDLRGKRVGLPEYQLTALVWIRGILAEHHGLPADAVSYHTGGLETPGRIEKARVNLPPGISVEPIGEGKTLAKMLADGEIDALYSPRAPSTLFAGDGRVARLYPEPGVQEREYFATTGIFPIMHVIALRRDVYERNRWLAQTLTKAFVAAKELAYRELEQVVALKVSLPWLTSELERTRALMGRDHWSYGVEPNRHVLETFVRYAHEQGLARELLPIEDLFAPETLESFVI
jgi:ABC-type nitrate/sulfonate/bicarbonate transport system substrate-binding protein